MATKTDAPAASPVRVRHRSLIAATMRTVITRLATGQCTVEDKVLIHALAEWADRLDHPSLCIRGEKLPTTIEELLREALRIGVDASMDWWTASFNQSAYAHLENGDQLRAAVCADALPELLARYYLLPKK